MNLQNGSVVCCALFLFAVSAQAQVNDNCSGAATASLGLNFFDSSGANTDGVALDPNVCDFGTFGNDQVHADLWFTFAPAVTGLYDIASINSLSPTFDSRLAVYSSLACPASPANVIDCDDDSGGSLQARIAGLSLTSGLSYLIRVGSYEAFTVAEFADLSISLSTPPASNNACSMASVATLGANAYNNLLATTDGLALDPLVCDMGSFGDEQLHDDVWFQFTPATSSDFQIETVFNAPGFPDTRLAVYGSAGCPDDPADVIACDDDSGVSLLSLVTVPLLAGNTYKLRIGNYAPDTTGASGDLTITEILDYPNLCNGDGGDQLGCTNCPCGNNANAGTVGGCLNSSGNSARLAASGSASVSLAPLSMNDLRFSLSDAPANAFCVLQSGDAVAPGNTGNPCFGMDSGLQSLGHDGLRCAIMNTRRHGGRPADANGDVGVTTNPWGGEGGPSAGIAQAGSGFAAGQTRFFQVTHRENSGLVCMRGLNTSQAVEVLFVP